MFRAMLLVSIDVSLWVLLFFIDVHFASADRCLKGVPHRPQHEVLQR